MATTSLWHIKGRLSDLIAYVENPAKTVPKGSEDFLQCVFVYPEPAENRGRLLCHRPQLPEADGPPADDPDQTAVRQGGQLHRLAWVPELQTGRSRPGAVP